MVKRCCVVGCTTSSRKTPELKFCLLPVGGTRREKWLKAINRSVYNPTTGEVDHSKLWSPKSNYTHVCGLHFISGQASTVQAHPDYVPSVFEHTSTRPTPQTTVKSTERFERRTKRSLSKDSLKVCPPAKKRLKFATQLGATSKTPTRKQSPPDLLPDIPPASPGSDPEFVSESWFEVESANMDIGTPIDNMAKPIMQTPLEQSERESLYIEIDNLRRERDEALAKVAALETLLDQGSLSAQLVAEDDKKCQMMTGIKWTVFLQLVAYITTFFPSNSIRKGSLSIQDQIFLTLVKLRHNVSFDFLAYVRGVPKSTTIDTFWRCVDLLHDNVGFMVKCPDRGNIFATIPPVFRQRFPRLTCIIDCFEIFIDAPKNLLARAKCYSNYKKHCTVKVLIGCNPHGMVTFLLKAWGGRVTDGQIVRESGFIDPTMHHPGDQILADRGFRMQEDLATKCGAELLTPAFTKGKKQMSAAEIEKSRDISAVRIHIERVIGLMKNRFTILQGPIPIRSVQGLSGEALGSDVANIDKIIRVCAALTNMGEGIVYKV